MLVAEAGAKRPIERQHDFLLEKEFFFPPKDAGR